MKRVLASVFAAVALAGAGLATSGGAASAAPAGPRALSCSLAWSDANTAGVKCYGGTFVGAAKCKNGRTAQGALAASGTTSYAYCSSLGSSLKKPVEWRGIPWSG
ncbi:hypothetical protein ACIGEZ_32725 [Streptomyces sp. NPDC085481]|uniref:hypothetical protein n=1 Tax=Streptomyces sp. NPDC085481 TaxID=3365727 RepID=UPI0037D0337C